jgi:hypothetical protein
MAMYSPNQHHPSDPAPVASCMRSGMDGLLRGSTAERPTEADSQGFRRLTLCSEMSFSDTKLSTCHF